MAHSYRFTKTAPDTLKRTFLLKTLLQRLIIILWQLIPGILGSFMKNNFLRPSAISILKSSSNISKQDLPLR